MVPRDRSRHREQRGSGQEVPHVPRLPTDGSRTASHDVFPKVMWIVRGERRQRLLADAFRRDRELKAAGLFTVVTTDLAIPTLLEAGS